MKIVFLIADMQGGGTERVIAMLANEYARRDISVVIMQIAGHKSVYHLDERVEVLIIAKSSPTLADKIIRLKRMRSYFRKNKDIIIFSPGTITTIYAAAATLAMKRFIFVSERVDPECCPHPKWRDWAYKRVDRFAFQTEELRNYYPPGIRAKGTIVMNPVAGDIPKRTGNSRAMTVVAVGRLHEQKNYPLLLAAFKIFVAEFPDYSLHIYGEGPKERELKELTEEMGLTAVTTWHGFVPDVQMQIVDSGMFVLSSDYEGIANSMLEALAMGIPTIATDSVGGGNRVHIEDGINGLLVPMKDEKALAQAMKRIASDEVLATRLSDEAIKIRESNSVKEIADQFLALME
ncbi:MAG: glycosyltransferase [Lachnospiraceae bacterium]|jgi:glycosyltransferase involved in cell wall biosynthesis|nr:glycosyltransferase [Lachnospiraceae bacterium]